MAPSWLSAAVGTIYQQAACPPEMRGRVSAVLRWVSWGTLPLGGLIAGALGGAIGVHLTLWVAVTGAACPDCGCTCHRWGACVISRPAGLQPA
jgi:hypothetical protein